MASSIIESSGGGAVKHYDDGSHPKTEMNALMFAVTKCAAIDLKRAIRRDILMRQYNTTESYTKLENLIKRDANENPKNGPVSKWFKVKAKGLDQLTFHLTAMEDERKKRKKYMLIQTRSELKKKQALTSYEKEEKIARLEHNKQSIQNNKKYTEAEKIEKTLQYDAKIYDIQHRIAPEVKEAKMKELDEQIKALGDTSRMISVNTSEFLMSTQCLLEYFLGQFGTLMCGRLDPMYLVKNILKDETDGVYIPMKQIGKADVNWVTEVYIPEFMEHVEELHKRNS